MILGVHKSISAGLHSTSISDRATSPPFPPPDPPSLSANSELRTLDPPPIDSRTSIEELPVNTPSEQLLVKGRQQMVSRSLGAVFALVMLCFLFLSCSVLILNSQHHTGSPYDHRTLNNDQVNPHAGYLNLQLEQFLAKFAKTNPDEFHHLTGRDGAHAAPHISKLTQYSPPTYTKVKLLTRACANIILDEFQLTLETCFAPTSDFHLTSVHHPDLDGSLVCGTTAWKSVDREEVPLDQCPKTEETGWVYVLKGLMLRASSSHQVSATKRTEHGETEHGETVHGEQWMANSASSSAGWKAWRRGALFTPPSHFVHACAWHTCAWHTCA